MNRFTHEGRFVLDADDKPWPVNQWHSFPRPEGIEAPLPPVPAEKTKEELDAQAFMKYHQDPDWKDCQSSCFNTWIAACRYARKHP